MFTIESTLGEIKAEFDGKGLMPYLIYNQEGNGAGNFFDENTTLGDIQQKNPSWNAADMAYGLNRLQHCCKEREQVLYNVYTPDEIVACPSKECVKIIFFPAENNTTVGQNISPSKEMDKNQDGRFVILAAGGAYGAVCSMTEAFPAAAKLNELGISVFCLNYRVGGPAPLFPHPMEDLAAAYTWIWQHAEQFGVNPVHYAVGGFSAGGHLAATCGLGKSVYLKSGCLKPELLLLVYPLVAVWDTIEGYPEAIQRLMLGGYLGEGYTRECCAPYEIVENADESYPPTYLVQAEDDGTVPIWNSERLYEKLASCHVNCRYERHKKAGHGFGLGSGTEAAGWVERAVDFWKGLD